MPVGTGVRITIVQKLQTMAKVIWDHVPLETPTEPVAPVEYRRQVAQETRHSQSVVNVPQVSADRAVEATCGPMARTRDQAQARVEGCNL